MYRLNFRMALLLLCLSGWCVDAAPARVLFPKSLHLTRQVLDPVTGSTITFEEYCFGNRVVSVSGDKTVIVDYEKQEITEIDRHAGTYSVSRFDEIASVAAVGANAVTTTPVSGVDAGVQDAWTATPRGVRGSAAGRSLEHFELTEKGEAGRKLEVGIDHSVALSEEAVEVLIGAAYPNPRRDEHEPLLRAAGVRKGSRGIVANAAPAEDIFGLPVTQSFTYSDSGSQITFRMNITRIGAEAPPSEMLIIPPAAKRVESPAVAIRRQLRELDHPSTSTPHP